MLKSTRRSCGWRRKYDARKWSVLVIFECGNAKMERVEFLKKILLSIIRATSLRLNLFCDLINILQKSLSGHIVIGHQNELGAHVDRNPNSTLILLRCRCCAIAIAGLELSCCVSAAASLLFDSPAFGCACFAPPQNEYLCVHLPWIPCVEKPNTALGDSRTAPASCACVGGVSARSSSPASW